MHGRQADPAAAVHGEPVTRLDPPVRGDGAERGGEAAAERGRRHEVDGVRQPDEVGVGGVQRDPLGEGAVAR